MNKALPALEHGFDGKAHYPAAMPALADGVEARRHTVAIVGGGPVGLAMALYLQQEEIDRVVLEADDAVCDGSRAIGLSRRSMQILDTLGVAAPMLDYGLPRLGSRAFHGRRELGFRPLDNDPRQRFPVVVNIDQTSVEDFLVEALLNRDADAIRWQTVVAAIAPGREGVRLSVENPLGSYVIDADWVIACDGAASTVRRALDLKLHGTQYEDRYAIVDVKLDDSAYPSERRIWFDPPANPGSTIIMHKQPANVWRVDFRLREDERPEELLESGELVRRVAQHLEYIGETGDWKVHWVSWYSAKALTLDEYCHGRVIFAGDAAHLVPIFGARGMNSGLEDVSNLGWKLTAVIRDRADESLLSTYTAERRAAALGNMRYATMGAEFVGPQSRGAEILRKAVLGLIPSQPQLGSLVDPRTTHAIPYTGSPLVLFPDRDRDFAGGPHQGDVSPDVDLPTSAHGEVPLLRLVHGRITLLAFPDDEARESIRCALVGRPEVQVVAVLDDEDMSTPEDWVRVQDVGRELSEHFAATPGTAYLIRPDGFIAARWLRLDVAELARAVQALRPSTETA